MKIRAVVAFSFLALSGCAASRQEVAARLGSEYIGQNVDALVMRFGPPASTFRMNSGGSSYVWQLAATTDVAVSNGYGSVQTRVCKVTVAADPKGVVSQLDTEDSNAGGGVVGALGGYGSICARRLGMKPGQS